MFLISLTSGGIVNLVINFIFIPRFQGVGAILGTIVAEFTVAFIQFFMLRNEIPIKKYMLNGVAFLGIGLIMYIVIYLISNMNGLSVVTIMAAQIICGVIVYLSLSAIYMVKAIKQPFLVNEILKFLHIRKRF